MTSKPERRANNFTVLRLGLALAVVLGHFRLLNGVASPSFPFNYASFAVDGFFVVSGYLVTGSFDRDPHLLSFYVRRLFRIYPLYILVVAVQTLILGAIAPAGWAASESAMLHYFAANAVFANFLHYDLGDGALALLHTPGLNPSLWTLKIELGFYLIVPLIWACVRRFGGGALVAIFLVSAAYFVGMRSLGHAELAKELPGQLQFFVLGIAAYRYRAGLVIGPRMASGAMVVLAVAVTALLGSQPMLLFPILVGAQVMVTALWVPAFRLSLDISYGVYLLHAPLIQLALLFGWYRGDWIGLAAVVSLTLLLAVLAERLVEAPCIALGQRLTQRGPLSLREPVNAA